MTEDSRRTIRFTLNGRPVAAGIAVYDTVVDVLQREFALFGARESCGQGLCGCCTVMVDGTAVSGCLYLAAFVDGAEVVTIEGLAGNGDPASGAAGLCLRGRVSVRLLHTWLRPDDEGAARAGTASHRRSHPSLPVRQSLPLRVLSRDPQGREDGGRHSRGIATRVQGPPEGVQGPPEGGHYGSRSQPRRHDVTTARTLISERTSVSGFSRTSHCRTVPFAETVNAKPGSSPFPGVVAFCVSWTSFTKMFRVTAPVGFSSHEF